LNGLKTGRGRGDSDNFIGRAEEVGDDEVVVMMIVGIVAGGVV
jgi:hypothetical protein